MINLLPPDTKEAYKYAGLNKVLLRWVIGAAIGLVVACLLLGAGYIYLNQSIATATTQIADGKKELQNQNLPKVQKEVTSISNNLKLVVQVLSKEILFSKLLKQLAAVTPSNVILTNLVITQTQGGVEITAQTTNYDAATQLQINLADPKNQIFSKADIVSINCTGSGDTANSDYPCTADIRALFAANNPFLFVNAGSSKK